MGEKDEEEEADDDMDGKSVSPVASRDARFGERREGATFDSFVAVTVTMTAEEGDASAGGATKTSDGVSAIRAGGREVRRGSWDLDLIRSPLGLDKDGALAVLDVNGTRGGDCCMEGGCVECGLDDTRIWLSPGSLMSDTSPLFGCVRLCVGDE